MIGGEQMTNNRTNSYEGDLYYGNQKPNQSNHN